MKRIVVTLDLDSKENPDYKALNELMAEIGFSVVSPSKGIELPCNTYLGEFGDHVDIKTLRDLLWKALMEAGLHPTALFGGSLQDWALKVE